MKQKSAVLVAVTCMVSLAGPYALLPELRAEVNAAVLLVARADIAPLREYLLGFGW
jgi:hypothetical protein